MGNSNRDEVVTLRYDFGGTDEGRALASTLNDIAAGSTAAAPAARALIEQLNGLSGQSAAVDAFVKLKAEAGELQGKLTAATDGLAALNKEFDRSDTSNTKLTAAFTKAEATVASLTARHNQLTAQVATAGGALEKAGIDTGNLDTAHRGLATSIAGVTGKAKDLVSAHEKTAEATHKVGEETEKGKEKLNVFGEAVEYVQKHLKELVTIASAVELAMKAIEFGKEGFTEAAAIEAQLSRIKALAQGTAEQFGEMEEKIDAAAKTVNLSSLDAAKGLDALVGQGLKANDAMSALVPTLQLAKIANIDVGVAAKDVADTLKAFNLPASEAQRVVDLLTASSHGAAGGLQSIAAGAAQLAPDARTLGLSLGQTVEILGILESKGLDTEKAVRGLRTIFQDLQNPASALRVNLVGLGDGTSDFNRAVAALTAGTPQANAALNGLAGGSRTIVELFGQAGPNATARFAASLGNVAGQAKIVSDKLDDNLLGAYKRFSDATADVAKDLAKPVLKPLTDELVLLSKRFDDLATNGNLKKIEQQIGDIASKGFAALNKALDGVNWETFGDDAIAGLGKAKASLDSLVTSAEKIGNAVNKVADVVGGAVHAVAIPIDELKAGVTGATSAVVKGVGDISGRLAEFTGVGKDASKAVSDFGAAGLKTAQDFQNDVSRDVAAVTDDFRDLVGIAPAASSGLKGTGAAASEAAPEIKKHGEASEAAAAASEKLGSALQPVPAGLHAIAAELPEFSQQLLAAAASQASLVDSSGKTRSANDALISSFDALHVKSQAALQATAIEAARAFATIDKNSANTAAGLADRRTAFLAYASAAVAASVNLDQGTRDGVQAQLEAKAAALGLLPQLQAIEASTHGIADANRDMRNAVGDNAAEMDAAAEAAKRYKEALDALQGKTDNNKSASENLKTALDNAANSTEKQAAAAEGAAKVMRESEGAAASLAQVVANVGASFDSTSKAAGDEFRAAMERASFNIGLAKVNCADLTNSLGALNAATADTSGFVSYFRALAAVEAQTKHDIETARTIVKSQTDIYNQFANDTGASLDTVHNKLGATLPQLLAMSQALKDGTYNAGLLGAQDLAGLQTAVDSAIAKIIALKDAAAAADTQLKDLNDSLQDQIDQQNGDKVDQENRSYEKQKANIEALAAQADAAGKASAEAALARLEQIHQANLKKIADEAAAAKAAGQGGGASGDGSAASSGGGGAGAGGGAASSGGARSASGGAAGGAAGGAVSASSVNLNLAVSLPKGAGFAANLTGDDARSLAEQIMAHAGPALVQHIIYQLQIAKGRT